MREVIKNKSSKEKNNLVVKKKRKNIWLITLNDSHYNMLKEMNNSHLAIIRWQKKRLLKSFLLGMSMVILYFFMGEILYLVGGLLFSIGFYYLQARNIKGMYQQFKFERHLQFSKFTRLLIPYLKQKKDGGNLYGVFNKIVKRLDYEEDQQLLMKLMQEMTDHPNDIKPFIDYAEQSSSTDMSVTFMSNLFDIRQGGADLEVIEGLDRLAGEELMRSVDEIIAYKSRKFSFFPTKLTMSSFILVLGFAVAILVYNLKEINFTGM